MKRISCAEGVLRYVTENGSDEQCIKRILDLGREGQSKGRNELEVNVTFLGRATWLIHTGMPTAIPGYSQMYDKDPGSMPCRRIGVRRQDCRGP